MPQAPLPSDEAARLEALREIGVLNSLPTPEFDDLTVLASRLCEAPIALVSLVDEDRQWFKSCVGLSVGQTSRESAICAYTILQNDPLVIRDTLLDVRTADSALVVGPPFIRFYAGVPLRNADGRALGAFCVMDTRPRDLTAEQLDGLGRLARQAASQLDRLASRRVIESTTDMLRHTGHIARVGGWSLDLATQNLRWSDVVYEIHDLDPGTPITVDRAISFYAPESRPIIAKAVYHGIKDARPWDLELPMITAKGRRIYVRAQGEALMRDGKPFLLRGAFQDVTEGFMQREALSERLEKLQEAETLANLGHWSWDARSGVIEWSEQVFKIHRREMSLGTPDYGGMLALYDAPSARMLDRAVKRALEQGTPYAMTLRTSDEDERYLAAKAKTRRDASGAVVGLYGTVCDVSAQVITERRLEETTRAATAASRAKSEFLANMSHEIRTPLTAILGFAELLRDDGDLNAAPVNRLQTIDTICRAGKHLLTVINDILDLSKIEADRMSIERVETPLTDILREVVSINRALLNGKSVVLDSSVDPSLPDRVLSDPTRLRQVLMNLVGNAVKFTDSGRVTVAAFAAASGAVPAARSESRLIIEVRDTGPGLNADQAGKLFCAFTQADATVTRRHGGSGLGLTISRRLAELMGGSVTLAWSEPGKGSCFRVELPLVPVTTVEAVKTEDRPRLPAPVEGSAQPPRLRGRILFVDDGADNQRLISFHLRRAGAEVETASNGVVALRCIERARAEGRMFDLMVTDMQMPEMDGYTLARTLRERGSDLSIIALTAHAMEEDRQKCLDAGCDDYATKPIDKATLLEICNRWIGRPVQHRKPGRAA